MSGRIVLRSAKRKLESNAEVICLSSDDDHDENGSDSDDDDDTESSYIETENDDSDEEDSNYVDAEDTLSISGEEDLIDLSSDSEGVYVNKAENQPTHEIVQSAGNTGYGDFVPLEHHIQGAKKGKDSGRALNRLDENFYAEAMNIITGGRDMKKLTVEHCRAYLRKYCLRRTGSKEVLIKRIQEHIVLKDGGGLVKYPRSSFAINCTGDACTGDIVLFKQKVYGGYDIASRSSALPPLGKRVVAGRIVKESYGAEKQQHTFTVEVLWSTGMKALPPLCPLIIKGRNLYRLRTFRQYWPSEEERRRVLAEKHARGNVARRHRVLRVNRREQSGRTQKKTVIHNPGQAEGSASNLYKRKRVDTDKERSNNTKRQKGGSTHARKMSMPPASSSQREWMPGSASDQNLGSNTVKAFVSIKASVAGLVIGKGGTNIKEISKVSGAKLYVREDERNPSLRLVHITGAPEQIQVAREMVLQILLKKGSSQAVQNTGSIRGKASFGKKSPLSQ